MAIKAFISKLNSSLRLYNGSVAISRGKTSKIPPHKLELYEYEASPWCKRVRETVNILDLKVRIKPCPRETFRVEGGYSNNISINRKELAEKYGRERLLFPCLVDVNKNIVLNDSSMIIEYLWNEYGNNFAHERPKIDKFLNGLPKLLQLPLLFTFFPMNGVMASPTKFINSENLSNQPSHKPLVLYSCEPSIHGRFVREALSTLQIHYDYISTADRAKLDDIFLQKASTFHFNSKEHFILIDPNNNIRKCDSIGEDKGDANADFDIDAAENFVCFLENDSENAIKYLFDTYQNGDTLKMTNQIENNLGRNGSFMKQMVENISSSSFLK